MCSQFDQASIVERWTLVMAQSDEHTPQRTPTTGCLRDRLAMIEAALDRGDYGPGPWRRLVDELRDSVQTERALLAPDVSRVSRKLHLLRRRRKVGVVGAILLEGLGGTLAGLLIAAALTHGSTLLALVGMALLVTSLEPLVKLSVGTALGVEYDYAYLYGGVEPRFKMSFGSYLTLSPLRRALVQLAGMPGSMLGALIAAELFTPALPAARIVSWVVFWLVLAANIGGLIAELAGVRRLGPLSVPPGSSTALVEELRCWWHTRGARSA
jgi:hypothetical protein